MPRINFRFVSVPLVSLLALTASAKPQSPELSQQGFLVKPYVQLGNNPRIGTTESLSILWQSADTDTNKNAKWTVEANGTPFAAVPHRVALVGTMPYLIYRADLTGLPAGSPITYRVLRSGQPIFVSTATTRKPANAPYRFVVFGDCAENTPGQRAIAYQTYKFNPDFVFITGDIVYDRGLMSQYRTNYFPIYNAEIASRKTGAPLIRSTLFLATPGNHDLLERSLDRHPDSLAYYLNWAQPLNGAIHVNGSANTPVLHNQKDRNDAFLKAAGNAYPVMANFSYDYGNSHWTVLDANPYMNWSDPRLVAWLEHDLEAAQTATWRFVAFHQPPFHSSRQHRDDQWMRVIAPILEKYRVDIVFNGHVHNYQRSYPLRFKPLSGRGANNHVDGTFFLDKNFDGERTTNPNGVLYLVTGGGGAPLYDPAQGNHPETWKSFTAKFVSNVHSMTGVTINGKTLIVRQISENGATVDRFIISK